MSFSQDLEYGNRIQQKVLEEYYPYPYRVMEDYFPYWDVVVFRDGKHQFFEFKADRRAANTGNLAIETLCNKKPSGISATKADYWIHCVCVGDTVLEVYEIPVKTLSQMVIRNDWDSIRECDDGKNVMYIFKKEKFAQWLKN